MPVFAAFGPSAIETVAPAMAADDVASVTWPLSENVVETVEGAAGELLVDPQAIPLNSAVTATVRFSMARRSRYNESMSRTQRFSALPPRSEKLQSPCG